MVSGGQSSLTGCSESAMSQSGVQRVDREHIDTLVKRLESLGALSAKIRCLLLLLKNDVNKCACHIFVSGSSDDMAVAVITESAPSFHSVSAVAPDSSGGLREMAALLGSPQLAAPLWGVAFRADFVPAWLEPLLASTAAAKGVRWRAGVRMEQYSQPPLHPPVQWDESPGITCRPLDASHFDTVKRFWPYAKMAADADVIIRDGLLAGLSIGAFIADDGTTPSPPSTEPGAAMDADAEAPDGLVSWCVLNHNGSLAFMHTLDSHRRRGLGALVLARLTELCQQRGYPCSASTALGAEYGTRALRQLGYVLVGEVVVGGAQPARATPQ